MKEMTALRRLVLLVGILAVIAVGSLWSGCHSSSGSVAQVPSNSDVQTTPATPLKSFVPDAEQSQDLDAARQAQLESRRRLQGRPRLPSLSESTDDPLTRYMGLLLDLYIEYDVPPEMYGDMVASLADNPWPSQDSIDRFMAYVSAEQARRDAVSAQDRQAEQMDMLLMELERIHLDLLSEEVRTHR